MTQNAEATKPAPPRAERPNMKAYGISEDREGMMSWEWVDAHMARSRNYWICSVHPEGRPHVAPVWGVWLEGVLYFGTERNARKTRNLTANPEVAVHLESGDECVIFEGTVEEISDKALKAQIAAAFAVKYPPFAPDPEKDWGEGTAILALRPRLAFSWLETDYPRTATRWRFDRP